MKKEIAEQLLDIIEQECPEAMDDYARDVLNQSFSGMLDWTVRVRDGVPVIELVASPRGDGVGWVKANIPVERFLKKEMWEIYQDELTPQVLGLLGDIFEAATMKARLGK